MLKKHGNKLRFIFTVDQVCIPETPIFVLVKNNLNKYGEKKTGENSADVEP